MLTEEDLVRESEEERKGFTLIRRSGQLVDESDNFVVCLNKTTAKTQYEQTNKQKSKLSIKGILIISLSKTHWHGYSKGSFGIFWTGHWGHFNGQCVCVYLILKKLEYISSITETASDDVPHHLLLSSEAKQYGKNTQGTFALMGTSPNYLNCFISLLKSKPEQLFHEKINNGGTHAQANLKMHLFYSCTNKTRQKNTILTKMNKRDSHLQNFS